MGNAIKAFKEKRKAERAYCQRLRSLPFETLAREHTEKLHRLRALASLGQYADAELIKELRRQVEALACEIRERANTGRADLRGIRILYR